MLLTHTQILPVRTAVEYPGDPTLVVPSAVGRCIVGAVLVRPDQSHVDPQNGGQVFGHRDADHAGADHGYVERRRHIYKSLPGIV